MSVGISRFEIVNPMSSLTSPGRVWEPVGVVRRAGAIARGTKAKVGSCLVALIAVTGCSATDSLSLESTCAEYFELPSDVRQDQLNRLGIESKWIGAGNPLYLINLEYVCAQSPSQTLRSAMGVK